MATTVVLVGTRKGAFIFRSDRSRREWSIDGPHFFGQQVNHLVLDPRDGRTLVAAAKTGHLGPTVFRSSDFGKSWQEASRPPQFEKREGGPAVDTVFFVAPGHASEPGTWYAGTTPHGLFRSEDGGATWHPVAGFVAARERWGQESARIWPSPDGEITHSVQVDPRDAKHLYVGLSIGGLFESRDRGETWTPLNAGVFAEFQPDGGSEEYGHDPHDVRLHPLRPDRLYQQNHCGMYRLDRPHDRWVRIGEAMPKEIGDIGFPIVLHPRDPDVAWVFPMDGTSVWPRTSIDAKPAAYRTRDAGATWERQDGGLPREHGYFTVLRQAMCADVGDPVGVYFGTTGGELWGSSDEGATWRSMAAHLPKILSVMAAEVA